MESGYVGPPGSRLLPHFDIHVDYLRALSLLLCRRRHDCHTPCSSNPRGMRCPVSYICLFKGIQRRIATGERRL
jgi:hypothetical protein